MFSVNAFLAHCDDFEIRLRHAASHFPNIVLDTQQQCFNGEGGIQ